jgi:hypothetical protein
MNSQTGDIFKVFDEKTMEANFGKPITLQEQMDLGALPDTQERLRRYKQMHADDRCSKCALMLRDHSLKEWQHCEAVLSHDRLLEQLAPETR